MRIWRKRWVVAVTGVAAALYPLYLAIALLLLNSSFGHRAVNRRPERLAVGWERAWSLYPGDLRLRGLTVDIHTRRTSWRLAADRGAGRVDLGALAHRRFRVIQFTGEGVTSTVERAAETAPPSPAPGVGAAGPPPAGGEPSPPARRRWAVEFDRVILTGVREIVYGAVQLRGDGAAEGSFTRDEGGRVALTGGRLRMPAARLLAGGETLASAVELAADLAIAPYAPRDHPGAAGFDFVTGTVTARGDVPEWPFLARFQAAADGAPTAGTGPPDVTERGGLTADLRLVDGELAPGTRLAIRSPRSAAGAAEAADAPPPFSATLAVDVASASDAAQADQAAGAATTAPRLVVAVDAPGFAVARAGGPPWLRAARLTLDAATPEVRLSRLLADVRDLRDAGGDGPPNLDAELTADGFELNTAGPRLVWRLAIDRARGRIDLPALLRREVRLDGVRGDGVVSRMERPAASAAPVSSPAPPTSEAAEAPAVPVSAATAPPATGRRWAVTLTDADFTAVREVAVGDAELSGAGRLTGGLELSADGALEVPGASLDMPRARLRVGGETAAAGIAVRLAGRLASTLPGGATGAAALRPFSGSLAVRGRVGSLGFLRPYLAAAPWLALKGRGDLDADVRVADGCLQPGSRLAVTRAQVEATILDDVATGAATVTGLVTPARTSPGAPETSLTVAFDRFAMAPRTAPGGPAFIQGTGLRLVARTGAVDLAAPIADLRAEVDLPGAEVPDLKVYNAYLPDSAGLAILGGHGRLRFHLELDGAKQTGGGDLHLTSDAVRVRFKDLLIDGRLALDSRLSSTALLERRFELGGTRLTLAGVSFYEEDEPPAKRSRDWWARLELPAGTMVWAQPLTLDASIEMSMKNADLLLALFAQKKGYLHWFGDLIKIENLTASGRIELGDGAIRLDPFTASGGKLALRSRLRFTKGSQRGDLLVRYGIFKIGIELRDGERDFKFLRPEAWFESRQGAE